MAVLDSKDVRESVKLDGGLDMERYIPPPYNPLHEVIDVFVIVMESFFPITPLRHVPFPDIYDMRENEQLVIVVVVMVELDPPLTLTIDALTLAGFEFSDVTFTDVSVSDPLEI